MNLLRSSIAPENLSWGPLRTHDLTLDLLQPKDIEELGRLMEQSRAHLAPWLPWATELDMEGQADSMIEAALLQADLGNGCMWGIWKGQYLAGTLSVHWIHWEHGSCSLGYWLGENYSGQGLMTKACSLALQQLFGPFALHRVEVSAALENQRSCKLLERLGFVKEGVKRDFEFFGGEFKSHACFGLLSSEWKPT